MGPVDQELLAVRGVEGQEGAAQLEILVLAREIPTAPTGSRQVGTTVETE